MLRVLLLVVLGALALLWLPAVVSGKNYAVLISSIKGWENLAYSVQADVCHAYRLLKQAGMTDDDIILMSFGDAAWDKHNAFPGQLYNRATNSSALKAEDVNQGCGEFIDYVGYEVSPANFLAVLIGNASAVPPGRPVLQSGPEDNVFVSFEDHGSPGAVYFPDFAPLYAVDVLAALQTMWTQQMYSRLVFYLMACESGSMFQGLLPPNISIYATAAAAADVSAYPVYCSPFDLVNGAPSGLKSFPNCLASEFGLAWTNETETFGLTQSLELQYINVNASMTSSHPGQYGDLTWKGLPIGDIFTDYPHRRSWADGGLHVSMPEDVGRVSLGPGSFKTFLLQRRLEAAREEGSAEAEAAALADIEAEARSRQQVDARFTTFATRALREAGQTEPTAASLSRLFSSPSLPIIHTACMRTVDAAIASACGGYTDYSRRYAGLVINACRAVAERGAEAERSLAAIMEQTCRAHPLAAAME